MFNTICPECAAKMEQFYITTPVEGTERWGRCKLCFEPRLLMQYEQTPRRIRYKPTRPGGGERAKAGRR